jgi:methylmalonyl-CoA/ethylmalonyl-CoA epimerase
MNEERLIGDLSHVVIAVKDIEKAQRFFSEFMGAKFRKIGENKAVGFISVIGDNRLEILSPTRPDSNVAKFIDKRGEGLYAVGFKTPDAGKARAKAEKMGIRVVGDITDADLVGGKGHGRGMREIWLHPKDVFGVYTLLTQSGEL